MHCLIKRTALTLLCRASCSFTWREEEAVGELVVLAVGGAALTVMGRHSGVHSDTLDAGGNLRNRSHVLLRDTDEEETYLTCMKVICVLESSAANREKTCVSGAMVTHTHAC